MRKIKKIFSFLIPVIAFAVLVVFIAGFERQKAEAGNPGLPQLTNHTRVTVATSVENFPTWSPDGRRLAYESNRSGNRDIWVTGVRGGPAVNLTADYDGADRYPSWSPDGKQIAFWSSREGGGYFVMSALGGSSRKVAPTGRRDVNNPPQWSSDGKELAYVVYDSASAGFFIEITSLQRATSRRLRLPGRKYIITGWELSWSPDSRYFAYVDAIDRGAPVSKICVLRAADGAVFPVTDGQTWDWNPTWSRDGRTLYFVSSRGGSLDFWKQRLREDAKPIGSPERLTAGLMVQYARFSPDGRRLAYSKGRWVRNVWRVPILKNRPATWADAQQLTFDQAHNRNIELSLDGKLLVFDSDRDWQRHLWVMNLESRELQRVTTDPMGAIMPTWSPDGQEIAYHSHLGDNIDIWVVPVGGGPARQVTRHEAYEAGQEWSPDGRDIAFQSARSGNIDIWIIPAQGGKVRQVTVHSALDWYPVWSPDGQWITFLSDRTGEDRLWRVPEVGGRPELVTDIRVMLGVRSKDGKRFFFTRGGNVWEVPVEGGAEHQLTDMAGKSAVFGRRPHTDGQYIYFTSSENLGDLWLIDVVADK